MLLLRAIHLLLAVVALFGLVTINSGRNCITRALVHE